MATELRHITRMEKTQALFRTNGDHGQSVILTDQDEEWAYYNSDKSKLYYVANQFHWNGAAIVYEDVDFRVITAHDDILVDEYLLLASATDNRIRFEDNKITITVGGSDIIYFEDDQLYTNVAKLGLNTTPSALWDSSVTSIDFPSVSTSFPSISSRSTTLNIAWNCVYDDTDNRWEYLLTAAASRYEQTGGSHSFYSDPSGSLGDVLPDGTTANHFQINTTVTEANVNGADIDFRIRTDDATYGTYTFFVEGSTDRVGMGTNTPLLNVGSAAGDFSGRGLHIVSTAEENCNLILEGRPPRIVLCDRDGGSDDKMLAFLVDGGIGKFYQLGDDATTITNDNILVMDLGTGHVGMGTVPHATVELHIKDTTSYCSVQCESTSTAHGAEFYVAADTAILYPVALGSTNAGGAIGGMPRANMTRLEGQSCSSLILSTINSGTAPIVIAPGRAETVRFLSTGEVWFRKDSQWTKWGLGFDCGIQFDTTDMLIDYDLLNSGTTDFRIQEDGADRLVVLTGGSVGIGTSNPAIAKLYVNGAGTTANLMAIFIEGGGGSLDIYGVPADGGARLQASNDGAGLHFWTRISGGAATEKVTITGAGQVIVNGAISSGTLTLSAAGPTDNLDVSGVNTIFVDTGSNNVTLGGTIGGIDGQTLHIAVHDPTNNTTIEHNEGVNQSFFLHKGADETLNSEYGGWVFINMGGTHWHDVSHAQHV